MPFTNVWRLPGLRTHSDKAGVRRVSEALFRSGGNVFGWDMVIHILYYRKINLSVCSIGVCTGTSGCDGSGGGWWGWRGC